MEAVRRRLQVKFTTAARMIASLSEGRGAGTFSRRLGSYVRPSLLIVDEVGFLPLGPDEAALMFEVVCRRHERGSIILTSNKSYGAWAEVFSGDEVIATAILDRLLHHSTTILGHQAGDAFARDVLPVSECQLGVDARSAAIRERYPNAECLR